MQSRGAARGYLGRAKRKAHAVAGRASSDLKSAAFSGAYRPAEEGELPAEGYRRVIQDQFNRLYYHDSHATWRTTTWRGITIWKAPTDLWMYQEILHRVRPQLIIETGTAHGGSAHYLGDLCEMFGRGEVVSIDIEDPSKLPPHPRVTYLHGSSVAPEIVAEVRRRLPKDGAVLVILDSDHREPHVRAELAAYSPMVTKGSYLIVEDTNVNGHPSLTSFGPGPMEAARAFVAEHPEFAVDHQQTRLMLTFNPEGFLIRL